MINTYTFVPSTIHGTPGSSFFTNPTSVYQLQFIGLNFDDSTGVLAGVFTLFNVINWRTEPPDFGITGAVINRKSKVNYDKAPYVDQFGVQQPGAFQVLFQEQIDDVTFWTLLWSAEWFFERVGNARHRPFIISGTMEVQQLTSPILT